MHVVIFEGRFWTSFAPLSLGRPIFTLVTGMSSLLEKQIRHTGATRLTLWVRPELEQYVKQRVVPKLSIPTAVNQPLDDEPATITSGRTLHMSRYTAPDGEAVMSDNGVIRVAHVRAPGLSPQDVMQRTDAWLRIVDLPAMQAKTRLVESLSDLIHWNEESLIEDAIQLIKFQPIDQAGPWHLVNQSQISLGQEAKLSPGCVLDATKGPIVLGDHVTIGANAVVEGPCYLGNYSSVMPLSIIRPGTSIGPWCKVGGEISASIMLGYSNKSHDGFLGHSYVGKWANLGAGTTTSNLKNTYGPINLQIGQRTIPTQRRFLGALIGDHAKTAIHTRFNCGSYVGVASTVSCDGTAPKFIPSFTFIKPKGIERYEMSKAIEVATRVFARRNRNWSDIDEQLFHYVANNSAPEVEGMDA